MMRLFVEQPRLHRVCQISNSQYSFLAVCTKNCLQECPQPVGQNTKGEVGTLQTVHSIEELIEAECLPKNWLAVVQLVAIQQVGKLLPANPLDWCRWTGEGKCHQYLEGLLLPNGQYDGMSSTFPQPYYPSSSIIFPLSKVVSK